MTLTWTQTTILMNLCGSKLI